MRRPEAVPLCLRCRPLPAGERAARTAVYRLCRGCRCRTNVWQVPA